MTKRVMLVIHLDFEDDVKETDAYTLIMSRFTNMIKEKKLNSYKVEEWYSGDYDYEDD